MWHGFPDWLLDRRTDVAIVPAEHLSDVGVPPPGQCNCKHLGASSVTNGGPPRRPPNEVPRSDDDEVPHRPASYEVVHAPRYLSQGSGLPVSRCR